MIACTVIGMISIGVGVFIVGVGILVVLLAMKQTDGSGYDNREE